ncbi:MAG: bifunctional tetrahydrofolate synthase/dihydrofolate synthase [Pseudomonadota bacterium]|jgi:dihydrofolate synthase/folylpolyglutamate synthase|nr:MAG: bifunctional tetrahydrofolate synthase/dihydrofolate synthase [Pseudomonadota bacterium]
MPSPRSLEDWLRLQEIVHSTGIDLTLERVREVARRMGLLPPAARVITVAGTNGKGSTVACLAALLRALGHKAGAFTSPHLLRYHERIRVDGAEAGDAELVSAFEAIEAARGGITLTFFEFNALAALEVFRRRQVEFAVLEVGLGGRLDAVNIVDAEAAIVCSIGLDHADWLGTDIDAIGREKAGVFRPGHIAVMADPQMTPAVEQEARRIGARALVAGRDYDWVHEPDRQQWSFRRGGFVLGELPLPALAGGRQLANASAALATLHAMGVLGQHHAPAVSRALRSLALPGRFQVVPGRVEWILDVAHNEAAATTLARNLAERPCSGRTLCVTSILADKDIDAVARALAGQVHAWFVCGLDAPRGLTAGALASRSTVFAGATQCLDIAAGMRAAAAAAAPGDRIVVCGSFLAVAPALEQLGLF